MLSTEASSLTSLILERHGLVCRAVELEIRLELSRLMAAADCPGDLDPDSRNAAIEAAAELARLPSVLDVVNDRIAASWLDLDRVSPHER